jgi:hypothetical protein
MAPRASVGWHPLKANSSAFCCAQATGESGGSSAAGGWGGHGRQGQQLQAGAEGGACYTIAGCQNGGEGCRHLCRLQAQLPDHSAPCGTARMMYHRINIDVLWTFWGTCCVQVAHDEGGLSFRMRGQCITSVERNRGGEPGPGAGAVARRKGEGGGEGRGQGCAPQCENGKQRRKGKPRGCWQPYAAAV